MVVTSILLVVSPQRIVPDIFYQTSYAGFMPRRILELKFKGKRHTGRPRRRWFSQLLEDEEKEELAKNGIAKTRQFDHLPL
jgi:hypothetical protein